MDNTYRIHKKITSNRKFPFSSFTRQFHYWASLSSPSLHYKMNSPSSSLSFIDRQLEEFFTGSSSNASMRFDLFHQQVPSQTNHNNNNKNGREIQEEYMLLGRSEESSDSSVYRRGDEAYEVKSTDSYVNESNGASIINNKEPYRLEGNIRTSRGSQCTKMRCL